MIRTFLTLAAILAIQATAFESGAACTAGTALADVVESTPTSAFTDNGDATVTHSLTGLMWKRCAQGQSGPGCAGTATTMTWSAALAAAVADTTAGHNDWRVPNSKELESIVESCGYAPAINVTLFPNTPSAYFWVSTTRVGIPSQSLPLHFGAGSSAAFAKSSLQSVRLVRGGQSFGAYDAQILPPPTLDVDASLTESKYDALTDGLLVIRYLLDLTGTSLTTGALGGTATRTDPAAIKNFLDGIRAALDIDGNDTSDALTDGMLILRYLFGLRGAALIAGAFDPLGLRNNATAIEAQIQSLMP